MATFKVTWEIELDADTKEEAAKKALEMVSDRNSIAHAFEVVEDGDCSEDGNLVDLDDDQETLNEVLGKPE